MTQASEGEPAQPGWEPASATSAQRASKPACRASGVVWRAVGAGGTGLAWRARSDGGGEGGWLTMGGPLALARSTRAASWLLFIGMAASEAVSGSS